MENPVPWNLTDFFVAAFDPQGGITQYLGVKK